MSSRVYWLWLTTRAGIGPRITADLLRRFGSPEAIHSATRGELLQCDGLTAAHVNALCEKRLDEAERIMEICSSKDYHILTLGDAGYPERLRHIYDPPAVLYWRGRQPLWDTRPMVSIVGTRRATPYGTVMAERFGRSLAESGFLVVSGMAEGIDGAANRGALRASEQPGTIAVLGCGVDICYPLKNSLLFSDLICSGTLLSEFPPGSRPTGWHFPQRNRIISGLSVATLVIEAPLRSGALITAHMALDQGRDVYAMPGRLDEAQSAGCNLLIREREADLLTDPIQLVRAYGSMLQEIPDERQIDRVFRSRTGRDARDAEPTPKPKPAPASTPAPKPARASEQELWKQIEQREARGERRRQAASEASPPASSAEAPASAQAAKPTLPEPSLSPQERTVLEAVRAGARTADQLIAATGFPAPQLLSLVTMLELEALVTNEGGVISLCE